MSIVLRQFCCAELNKFEDDFGYFRSVFKYCPFCRRSVRLALKEEENSNVKRNVKTKTTGKSVARKHTV